MAVATRVRMASKPLFSFGIISDIQYADRAPVVGRARYERDAIVKLERTVDHWRLYDKTVLPLQCIVNLGDIIDGHEGEGALEKDKKNLLDVIKAFDMLQIPKYHVLGNHCVWNLGCEYTATSLKMPSRFYDIPIYPSSTSNNNNNNNNNNSNNNTNTCNNTISNIKINNTSDTSHSSNSSDNESSGTYRHGWRFVFLDGTDLSLMKDSHSLQEAQEYFKLHSHRMLEEWNGGFSKKQMQWLKNIFEEAKQKKEKLILFCHWPLLNLWSNDFEASLLWNAEDVLQMLDPEVVFMFMSGHMHENGYKLHNGIHHLTLGAIVTTREGEQAHGVVHVSENEVEIEGFGVLASIAQSLPVCNSNHQHHSVTNDGILDNCNTYDATRLE